MKYLILIGDGMGDRPMAEHGGKTVLELAATPHMDRLAREGLDGAQTADALPPRPRREGARPVRSRR